MKVLRDESGQALIFVALSLTCVLGFVGLATDVGTLIHAKRNLQIAADAGAIAGASELNLNSSYASVQSAAQTAVAANGISGATVTVNSPATGGYHTGAGNVEVIVSQNQPTFFMKVLAISSMTVAARAVATNGASTQACVYVLASSGSQTMDLQGSFDVSVPSCGIVVDSSDGDALNFTGGGGSLTAQSIGVVGGDGGKTGDSTPTPVTGIAPVSDPLAAQNYPVYTCTSGAGASCTTGASGTPSSVSCSDSTATQPSSASGAVCYGLGTTTGKHGSTDSISLTGNLNPGLYIINGDLTLGTVTGTGVTFYVTGNVTAANGTINLTAPGSGTYNGLAFYAPGDTGTLEFDFGSASGTVEGIIYAPDAEFELHDSGGDKNGGLQLITDLVVGTLYDQTATLTLTSYSKTVANSPLTSVALVE